MRVYLPILCMIVLVVLFVLLSFIASKFLAPKRPTSAKQAPYECGIVPEYELAERFPVKFYLVAMLFIVFDIETIFLFPWAVSFRQLGLFGLIFPPGLFARNTGRCAAAYRLVGSVSWSSFSGSRQMSWSPVKVPAELPVPMPTWK